MSALTDCLNVRNKYFLVRGWLHLLLVCACLCYIITVTQTDRKTDRYRARKRETRTATAPVGMYVDRKTSPACYIHDTLQRTKEIQHTFSGFSIRITIYFITWLPFQIVRRQKTVQNTSPNNKKFVQLLSDTFAGSPSVTRVGFNYFVSNAMEKCRSKSSTVRAVTPKTNMPNIQNWNRGETETPTHWIWTKM